ncbi:MAG: 50S ribosomal protein L4 [Spirochaetes bacterium]|nr:50S ribosomal protein L4 [Spirochaetota bacterium]
MKINMINIKGKESKEIELNDKIFNITPNKFLIYEAIKNELANKRQGTSSTKTKAEVEGSGSKPHKQKGTGRARVGTKRNPVWRGGGVAFGPKPRDYSYVLPKKIKRSAYKSILSLKLKEGNLKVIENFDVQDGKTKSFIEIFKPILKEEKSSLIVSDSNNTLMIKRASNNISWINCLNYKRMMAHTLYYSKNIILTEDAALELNKFFKD